jgi:DNA-binding Xre family transcriptional regulator
MDRALYRESLAANVRAELARRRITGRQMSASTGIKVTTMARRLNVGDFKLDELARIAKALDMPLVDLLPVEAEAAAS